MSRLRDGWNAAWYGPVAPARCWLAARVTLGMLAFDAWVLMVPRGGKYGAGGFNVAHFSWLDAVQPLPSPDLYVGLVLLCGFLALMAAAGAVGRGGRALLAVLYTYGWMMSQLDSYQHHYFLSWVLVCLAASPTLSARGVFDGPALRFEPIGAAGFKLLAALGAVLYAFTGISKLSSQWRHGEVLARLGGSDGKLDPFREAFTALGLSDDAFWSFAGHSVVGVQWVIAVAYLSYVLTGERSGPVGIAVRWIGLLAALSFHAGAEYLGLRIGWFSYYMFALTLAFFLPASWVHAAGWLLTWPWRFILRRVGSALEATEPGGDGISRAAALGVLALVSLSAALLVGPGLDLPGGAWAMVAGAAIILAAGGGALARRDAHLAMGRALAGALVLLAVWTTVTTSEARWNYYRYVGGDHLRRGELVESLRAYGLANTYAPTGSDRRKKVEQVKVRMGQPGAW